MFTKQLADGTTGSIMHGDPHTGNFFITVNDAGELVPEFIDTGLCVTRTSQEILRDATFITDYATGNSKGVANYFLDMCDIDDAERKAMLPELTAYIQDNIFGSGKNITEASTIISGIEAKINKMGIPLKADGTTALKAEMQFFSVIKEAGSLTGQSIDVVQVIKDMPKIAGKMIRNKVNPFKLVRNIATSLVSNPSQTIRTAYQFKVGREEALKLMKVAMEKWNK